MTTAYLVWGQNGKNWSSHSEWDVAVYPDLAAANQHARLANEWKACLRDEKGEVREVLTYKAEDYEPYKCPYDPAHTTEVDPYELVDYEWAVKEIPLVRHVDEFMEHAASGSR